MEIVKPVWDIACQLWTCTAGDRSYITDLQETLNSLKRDMDNLIAIRDDVNQRVEAEERRGRMRIRQVENWRTKVDETEIKVNKILQEYMSSNGSTCFKICRCRCRYSYKIGRKSKNLLTVIERLTTQGNFPEVTMQNTDVSTYEIPMGNQNLLGIESNLKKVQEGLKDDNVGIIGLYGMGGVGKTTLLKLINNELHRSRDDAFDCIFWIVASKNATIEKIQQTIMEKLHIPYPSSDISGNDIGKVIFNALKNKKYILMLDDVWETLDLFEAEGVGIPAPHHQNKSKIIFTTRLKDICFKIEAQLIVKVECLACQDGWSLFKKKLGNEPLGVDTESYATKIAEECKGLPLALIIIARAMSGERDLRQWTYALEQLRKCPKEFENLEEKVFRVLQLSYDYLDTETKKQCFLYCSLFPEDYNIQTDNLVDLWMGEGYLTNTHDIGNARNYGYKIIDELKYACLLESGTDSNSVKMHDIIRDMALIIADEKFLSLENAELIRALSLYQNKNVEKILVRGNQLEEKVYNREEASSSKKEQAELNLTFEYPKLSTFLCKLSPSVSLPELFNFTPNVRVLDLSKNAYVIHLPEVISNLELLEYLDISGTGIERLPQEMKCLKKLRYLLMNSMSKLIECPTETISGLKELLVFRMDNSPPFPEEFLNGLEELPNIQETSIYSGSVETIEFFMNSEKLQRCATYVKLENSTQVLKWYLKSTKTLESLVINNNSNLITLKCSNPTTLMTFNCLHYVHVSSCRELLELDFLAYAKFLIKLTVENCTSIRWILHIEKAKSAFLTLKEIYLKNLPCLKYICNKPLSFPTLETIELQKCTMLNKNPFEDMITTTNIKTMIVDEETWNSLNWLDRKEHYKQYFLEN